MKALLMAAAFCFLSLPAFAQEATEAQSDTRGDARPQVTQAQRLQEQIIDLYISNFKSEVELTDEQFLRLSMPLRNFIKNRFQAPLRRQALNQRRQQLLGQANPSEADVQQLNEEIAQFDRDTAMLEARFLTRVGSQLTPRQKLLLTQFNQKFFNEKLPGLINQAREQNAQRGQRQRPADVANGNDAARPNAPARPGNALRGRPNSNPKR
jgi:hypothetical protein